mmetsp:Transcript_47601/g.125725  ORF Transcript_47601/g.125725 Transcript_47601/m.125725 type:complete len:283 (+) Transcript_47601:90-938(+)
MPSQTLYLVRHGESTANHAVKNGVSSAYLLTDAALTESGENQARAISTAVALEGQPRPELLLVSPLRRTMQTAVLGFGEAVPHLLRPDIQETGNTPADRGDPKLGAALVREHGWASYAESYAALPAEWAVKGAGWKASARRRFQALLEFVAGCVAHKRACGPGLCYVGSIALMMTPARWRVRRRAERSIAIVAHHDFFCAFLGASFALGEVRRYTLHDGQLLLSSGEPAVSPIVDPPQRCLWFLASQRKRAALHDMKHELNATPAPRTPPQTGVSAQSPSAL